MSKYPKSRPLPEPGLYGWGDATCTGSELAVAEMLKEHLAPALIARDPTRIENIFKTLYHLPYFRSGSVHLSAISGIDMALWDIMGKLAGLPVYALPAVPSPDHPARGRYALGLLKWPVEKTGQVVCGLFPLQDKRVLDL